MFYATLLELQETVTATFRVKRTHIHDIDTDIYDILPLSFIVSPSCCQINAE